MRREQNVVVLSSQLRGYRAHLRQVSMLITDRVRAKIFRDLSEEQIRSHRIAGTGNSTGSRYVYGSAGQYPAFRQ